MTVRHNSWTIRVTEQLPRDDAYTKEGALRDQTEE